MVIDDAVIAELEKLNALAPLHNPVNIAGIREARRVFPSVPQLDLGFSPSSGFEPRDFVVSQPNFEAWTSLAAWPGREGGARALVGPKGSGKSHLAALWAARSGAQAIGRPVGPDVLADAPALLLYGARDQIVPRAPVVQFIDALPKDAAWHQRVAYYAHGYHMLLRDLEGPLVVSDIAAWIKHPHEPLPSGADRAARRDLLGGGTLAASARS